MGTNDPGLFGRLSASDHAANEAMASVLAGDIYAWKRFIDSNVHTDGFFAISNYADSELGLLLRDDQGKATPAWLDHLAKFSREEPTRAEVLRHDVGRGLLDGLTRLLENHARDVPENGFVLYISEYLRWCVVFRYQIAGGAAQLKYLHAIERPTGIYNIYDLLQSSSDETRSVMRNVLKNRAKLVAHRGVLTHVDRFTEVSVFGPSIDTLIVHELLVRLTYHPTRLKIDRVLEIGAGSGFLSAAMWTHLSPIARLAYNDVDLAAISCTSRNLDRVFADRTARQGIHGEFEIDLFALPFDLAVVNPPYIPAPKRSPNAHGHYVAAVHGTDLLSYVLREGMQKVAKGGAMLCVYSELAQREVDQALASFDGKVHNLFPGDGFDVMFDVEDVLGDEAWLAFLRDERGLGKDPSSGTYRHKIRVIALVHNSGAPTEIVSRIQNISLDFSADFSAAHA